METIKVEKIDALHRKSFGGSVEIGPDEGRKRFVIGSIVGEDLCKRRLIIFTRMLIAPPRIYAEALGFCVVFRCGLAKSEITFATINTEFDEEARAQYRNEIVGKMEVRRPSSDPINFGDKMPGK